MLAAPKTQNSLLLRAPYVFTFTSVLLHHFITSTLTSIALLVLLLFTSISPFFFDASTFSLFMTLVHCGSFASVHSHKPASPSRVSALRPTSLHRSFSGASLQAQSCVRVASSLFDDLCTNRSELVSIRAVGNSLTGLLGVAFQPARVPLHSVPVVPTELGL